MLTTFFANTCLESPEWLDENSGGQFYGYVTGTANLTCQAEAEPPPTFRSELVLLSIFLIELKINCFLDFSKLLNFQVVKLKSCLF